MDRVHPIRGMISAIQLDSMPIATTPAMRAARLVEDTLVGYGLGWQVMDYRGHPLLWHTGNGDGQIAYMAMRAVTEMKSEAPPPLPLSAYAGRYDRPLFGPVWVRLARSHLTLQMGDGQTADLEYHGDAGFWVWWRDPLFRENYGTHVRFAIDRNSVTALTTPINRDEFTAQRSKSSALPTDRGGVLFSSWLSTEASPSSPVPLEEWAEGSRPSSLGRAHGSSSPVARRRSTSGSISGRP